MTTLMNIFVVLLLVWFQLDKRGFAAASDGFFQEVVCPKRPLIRQAEVSLCKEERRYIKGRTELMKGKLERFMRSLNARDSDVDSLVSFARSPVNIGLAVSGGGYRSMLTGSGFLLGMEEYGLLDCTNYITGISGGSWILAKLILSDFRLDSLSDWDLKESLLRGVPDLDISDRNVASMLEPENLYELFQADEWFYDKLTQNSGIWARDYMSSSPAVFEEFFLELEEYSRVQDSRELEKRSTESLSRIKNIVSKFFAVGNDDEDGGIKKLLDASNNFRQIVQTYVALHLKVKSKKLSGFPISFTDYWGEALVTSIAPTHTTGSISAFADKSQRFQRYEVPLPIFVANCKNENLRNAVFEFTPFEFGSWTNMRLFIPLRYLGSQITAGTPQKCIIGFDEVGFVTATSSSLFNSVLMYVWHLVAPSLDTRKAVRAIFSTFGLGIHKTTTVSKGEANIMSHPEYAIYQPNPFYKHPATSDVLAKHNQLYLVDGGEDGENIPIGPLLIPERKLDVIFALDSSSDVCSFPNGTMLWNFYQNNYGHSSSKSNTPYQLLPFIPSSEEFVARRLLSRPVAFGCHMESYPTFNSTNWARNSSHLELPPILIYHANANHSFASNLSTFKLKYSKIEVEQMLRNGKHIFNFDDRPKYKRCLACLLVKRNYDRSIILEEEVRLPFFCDVCFSEYCYN